LDEAIEAAATGWARLPWAAVGGTGEARANEVGVTVRCLLRADGSVPDTEDEPDLLAILSRAY
jgi:prolyl-tRNA synthetase